MTLYTGMNHRIHRAMRQNDAVLGAFRSPRPHEDGSQGGPPPARAATCPPTFLLATESFPPAVGVATACEEGRAAACRSGASQSKPAVVPAATGA